MTDAVIESTVPYPENTLYFGCRSAGKDQHYSTEWAAHAARGSLRYRLACSRDGPEGVARTYVQNLMHEDACRLWETLGEKGGWAYISGLVKLASKLGLLLTHRAL